MKLVIKILCCLFFPAIASAQEGTINITPAIFEQDRSQALIAGMDGWLYKEGNDTAWVKKDIDTSGWKRLKPAALSIKFADNTGKLECWFRTKIKIDSTLNNLPLSIKLSTWAATDLYIDGRYITSRGNTGYNGMPYHENSPFGYPSYPVDLQPGHEYNIALHVVDHVTPIPPYRLKAEQSGLNLLIRITGVNYNTLFLQKGIKEPAVFASIWVGVCAILSLLFWLLYFQNRREKNLRLVALSSTFLTLTIYFNVKAQNTIGMSYNTFTLYDCSTTLCLSFSCVVMPLLLANIFNRKITNGLKASLLIYFTCSLMSQFLNPATGGAVTTFLLAFIFAVCLYYVISSWKNLKGAQWAIVAGMLSSMLLAVLFLLTNVLYNLNSPFLFYLSITGYALAFPISLLVYVSIRFKEIIKEVQQNAQRVIQLSEEKKEHALSQQEILQIEVNRQTAEIRTTLDNLKSTQSQLIQSEKMASLGELTAGIAHEIQNPLNFVNNFSEVNKELIEELVEEVDKGNISEVKLIANNIKENEEKINHHGKRADSIVKGMLQHSRNSSGQKEPTDINALCDEYLRLAYHGLRAKDNSFNATLKTDFDEKIDKINIIPQDIGRVVLNLITNALYAVKPPQPPKGGVEYVPTVSVSTKKVIGNVEVKVSDNGTGIPKNIIDKIFQPFFTTKPTGQGTGLGLSLAYDIVKAHGGELKVETKEGEGTAFIIQLPII